MSIEVRKTTIRIEAAVGKWQEREKAYIGRYGENVLQDRDFLKVKQETLKDIYNEYKNKKLSWEEKMDLRILRGQIRQMNERIYPNKNVRRLAALLSLSSRPVRALLKLPLNILSYTFRGKPAFVNKPPRVQPMRSTRMQAVTSPKGQKIPEAKLVLTEVNTQKAVTRKRSGQPRTIKNDPSGKKIKVN